MKIKISKTRLESLSDDSLVQVIGEAEHPVGNSEQFQELCELLNRIEFRIESYGVVNFFVEHSDEIKDLKRLAVVLNNFEMDRYVGSIKRLLDFHDQNSDRFNATVGSPEKYEALEEELLSSGLVLLNLHHALAEVASAIKSGRAIVLTPPPSTKQTGARLQRVLNFYLCNICLS